MDEKRFIEILENNNKKIFEKFEQVDENINKLETKMNEKIDKLETKMNEKIDKLETKMNEKIDKLETKMNEKMDKLETKMNEKMDKLETKIIDNGCYFEVTYGEKIDAIFERLQINDDTSIKEKRDYEKFKKKLEHNDIILASYDFRIQKLEQQVNANNF